MNPCLRPVLFAVVLAAAAMASAVEPVADVNVIVDLTPAGRKLTLPTPAQPAYYAPLIGGYHEEGETTAGDKRPPQNFVLHEFAKALAAQGYLVAGAQTPVPSVLLVFHWGSLNPNIAESGDPDDPDQNFLNEKKMVAMVAGQTLNNLNPFSERQEAMLAARTNRYYVMVTAYDFAAAKQHRKIALWRAKMSMPSAGVELADVVPVLIDSGAAWFGRETLRPVRVTKPLGHEGTVNLGELKVEEYIDPAAKPAEKPKQP
jgi:hypothetical protein